MSAMVANENPQRILLLAHRRSLQEEVAHCLPANTELKIVNEKYQFVRALLEFVPHLVLADSSVPCLASLETLMLVRETYEDMPFILLYDAVSHVEAAEALLCGATATMPLAGIPHLEVVVKEALNQHPEHAILATSRSIMNQIRENIAGLDQIRAFLNPEEEGTEDSYAASVSAEIESSIVYLMKLSRTIKADAV